MISGDRFWYSKPSSGFTPDQILNLDSMKLSSLLCANLPYIKSIQPNSFLEEDTGLNSEVLCDNFPELDLYLWINEAIIGIFTATINNHLALMTNCF